VVDQRGVNWLPDRVIHPGQRRLSSCDPEHPRGDCGGDVQVSSREERVAHNESTTRQINEQIEQAHEAAPTEGHVRVLCECGRPECDRLIAMTLAEYESVRADPHQFAVAHDHVLAEVEQVVTETDRYTVIAKREGTPAAVAVEEDPRG
jgi:hypothetical protein